tara:strand:+ start:1255 stop:1521 length:267 start_codon:yes stop_codon:yes gene_type:complete
MGTPSFFHLLRKIMPQGKGTYGKKVGRPPQKKKSGRDSLKIKKKGLYANIHAKRKRIAAGSGEKMRKPGAKGAPTAANFKRAAKTAKK